MHPTRTWRGVKGLLQNINCSVSPSPSRKLDNLEAFEPLVLLEPHDCHQIVSDVTNLSRLDGWVMQTKEKD